MNKPKRQNVAEQSTALRFWHGGESTGAAIALAEGRDDAAPSRLMIMASATSWIYR